MLAAMGRDKKDVNPLLLKLGVALAISFAGFLYSQFRNKRIGSNRSPPSSPASGEGSQVDSGRRTGHRDGLRGLQTTLVPADDTSVSAISHEEATQLKGTTDDSTVGISPGNKHCGDDEGFLLPEFNDLLPKEFNSNDASTGISPHKDLESNAAFKTAGKDEAGEEIVKLKNMVRVLRERERNLEIQLLEYYGLKEQETAAMELQNRLKINNMEAKLLNLKIESLQADNRRLRGQLADYAKVVPELESARAKIKILKRKIRSDAEQYKEQLSILRQKVSDLQDQEHKDAMSDSDVQKQLRRIKDLETESEELRTANLRLQVENSELENRLDSTQILAASVLEDPEAEALREINDHLRRENQDLAKEIERLQADRCSDAEELVYLRWLNACLRYELRNYQPPPGKTVARDLSKSLSPKSEEKAKQLILEYANTEGVGIRGISLMDFDSEYCSSSQASNFTDSGEHDDSSGDFSSATKTNSSNKMKLLSKLKRVARGKDNHHHNQISSTERTITSPATLRRKESTSTSSYEDMGGRHSCDTLSSQHNLDISETHLAAIEARIDGQKNNITKLSRRLSRSSLDIQRLRSLNPEFIRDRDIMRRNSDVGLSYGHKGVVLEQHGMVDLPEDGQLDHDQEELMKYAEVLKFSRESHKSQRKLASYRTY